MADLATKSQREIIVTDETVDSLVGTDGKPHSSPTIATLAILWNHRKAILQAAVVGLLLSTATAFLIPKQYESTARLMPPDQSSSSTTMFAALAGGIGGGGMGGGRGSGLGALAGDLLGLKNTSDMFIGVLQSNTVEDALINKFDLRKTYRDRLIEDARKDLEKKTSIVADRKSGIITIQVSDHDPQRAAAMAREYVDQLNRVVTRLNTSSAGREREFLEQRLIQVKNDLETAEKGFSEFASKNTAIDIPAQGKAMIEAAAALEGQLIASQTELESLRQIYTDSNVRVRSVQARVESLKRQLQKFGGAPSAPSSVPPNSDGDAFPSIRQLPVLGVPYADLYRNSKVQEAIYETLTEEFELAKVQEAKETPSVKILDPPAVPEKRSFPPRLLIVTAGTIFAFSLGLIWSIGKVAWNSADLDDPRKALAIQMAHAIRSDLSWVRDSSRSNTRRGLWTRFRQWRSKNQEGLEL